MFVKFLGSDLSLQSLILEDFLVTLGLFLSFFDGFPETYIDILSESEATQKDCQHLTVLCLLCCCLN